MIGSLGNYVFKIFNSPEELEERVEYSYATIETPERLLAFSGKELREIKLRFHFFRLDSLKPEEEIKKLKEEAKKESPLKLIIGNEVIGDFVIKNIETRFGNINSLFVTVELKEYR